MQSTGYGFIMPLYSIFHLLASKTAATNDLAQAVAVPDFAALEALPWSLTIGYIIPTILLAIPFQSNMLHQWFGGFWQIFPIWVTLLQHISRYFYAEPEGKRAKDATDRIHKRHVLHNAYLFPFTISAACHLGTLAVVGATQLRFRDIFIPPPFYSCTKMKSMSAGIHNFFQYDQYIGSAAALVWVIALDTNSKRVSLSWRDWILLLIKILALILVAGPGGALTVLMWHRDKRVLSAAEL